MSSENRKSFISSFPIWIPFIGAGGGLTALERTSSPMIKRNAKSGHCWLILNLRVKASSLYYDIVRFGFFVDALYHVDKASFYSQFNVFIMKGCWILSNALCMSIVKIMFLFFILLMQCIRLFDFQVLNQSCILRINPTCSWRVTLNYELNATILLPISAPISIKNIGL